MYQVYKLCKETVNILGFRGFTVSVTTIQLCCDRANVAIDNM